jgi:tetratricopeptide (TPR) repeat protein
MPGLMHLENILFHLVNAVLVYFLTFYLMPSRDRNMSLLPLIAALLFGLHPVNTESVNWISGRTDVLAGTFILASALCIMKFRELHERKYAVLALITFLGGALVKETAVAFLPGAYLLMSAVPLQGDDMTRHDGTSPHRLDINRTAMLVLGGLLVALFFYVPRFMTVTSHTSRIGFTLNAISNDLINSMLVMLRAFGFYVKKLVLPYPLNFAIMEIDPLYEVLAVPLIALCLYMVSRRTALSAVFTAGLILVAPAFVLAFGQIAWTPYAERYVYITSAFFIVPVVVYARDKVLFPRFAPARAAIPALLLVLFVSVISRGVVWQSDFKLSKDTVEKSPMSRTMRLVYSTVLTEKGDYSEALNQLNEGRKIPALEYDERFDLNAANILAMQGRFDEAIAYSEAALQKTRGTSKRALRSLIGLMEKKKETCNKPGETRMFDKKIFAYYVQLFKVDHDPHLLYQLGVTAYDLGDHKRSIRLFEQTRNNLTSDDPYRKFAQKNIDRATKADPRKHTDDY